MYVCTCTIYIIFNFCVILTLHTYSNTVNHLFISALQPRYWKGLSALSPPVSVLGWALCSSGQLLKSTAPAAPPPHSPLQYRSRLWHRPD